MYRASQSVFLSYWMESVLTMLSSPNVSSIKKKRIAHREATGICATASGYPTNASPGPRKGEQFICPFIYFRDALSFCLPTSTLCLCRALSSISNAQWCCMDNTASAPPSPFPLPCQFQACLSPFPLSPFPLTDTNNENEREWHAQYCFTISFTAIYVFNPQL